MFGHDLRNPIASDGAKVRRLGKKTLSDRGT